MKNIFKIIIIMSLFSTILFGKFLNEVTIKGTNLKIYTNCSVVLHDYNQSKCYSYKNHAPRFNMYYIDEKVEKTYKKRMPFKQDPRIPQAYQNYLKCYLKSGLDRGHLDPDANEDWSLNVLKTTYLMSNVVPEYPYQNRRLILKLEKLERKYAVEYKGIVVVTGAHFSDKHLRNQNDCANIPYFIYKIFFIKNKNKLRKVCYKLFKLFIITDKKIYDIKDKKIINKILRLEKLHIVNY